MARLRGSYGVLLHDVVVHEGGASEQTEAARATEHTAKHMLCCLLQPVAHCILKLLVPHHRTCGETGVNVCVFTGLRVDRLCACVLACLWECMNEQGCFLGEACLQGCGCAVSAVQ